ncbi:IS66 family insertion sequence element accessory protein TnpA [Niallia sp. HCP3S3_B10]|uniref:IS66 family insertion sequence element accessory protein TnpA n=1 Tax=Niallia sp. HCP3S3_B10 TaxID=3438944 RepID=UPI003F8892E1
MTKKPNLELRKEWEQRISDYKASGQCRAKWCEDNGVSYHQFGYWKRRLKDQSTEKTNNSWVPVIIEEPTTAQCESLLIKVGSVSIEVTSGFNSTLLAEVIKVLKEHVE